MFTVSKVAERVGAEDGARYTEGGMRKVLGRLWLRKNVPRPLAAKYRSSEVAERLTEEATVGLS